MKAEQFAKSMNEIKDPYIQEAASYSPAPQQKKPKTLTVWRTIAIAACALLVVSIGIGLIAPAFARKGSLAAFDYKSTESPQEAEMGGAKGDYNSVTDTEDFGAWEGVSENSAGTANDFAGIVPTNPHAKIIYTASLTIETTAYDDAQAQIAAATKAHGGYFENLDQDNYSYDYRGATYRIRIPAEEFDAFLQKAQSFGTVVRSNQNADDISEVYYDTQSRLESAQARMKKLNELMEQAQNMSDIITIQNEISNVQWEIDNLTGTLQKYDSDVSYATVSLRLDEVYKTTEESAPTTFGGRISKAFKGGISGFGNAMEDLVIWFAGSWTWIMIVAIVFAAGIIVLVKFTKKADKPNEKENEEK